MMDLSSLVSVVCLAGLGLQFAPVEDAVKRYRVSEFTHGSQRASVLREWSVHLDEDQVAVSADIFVVGPDGVRARIFSYFDPLQHRFRYALRFEDSGWRAEFHFETSLNFQAVPDPAGFARATMGAVERGEFEARAAVLLGSSLYAKGGSRSQSVRELGRSLASDLDETLGDELVPGDACRMARFLAAVGGLDRGGNFDVLLKLILYAAAHPTGRTSCVDAREPDWEGTHRQVSELDQDQKELRSSFSKERPKFRLDPF